MCYEEAEDEEEKAKEEDNWVHAADTGEEAEDEVDEDEAEDEKLDAAPHR